jgi:hypothetical protein
VRGTGTNNADMAAALFGTGTGIVLRCNLTTNTPPASADAGEPC